MNPAFDQDFQELKQKHEKGIVVGLKKVAGVAPRLDIDVFLQENPKAFNLFLIAYDKLQQELRGNKMGFFQIAGIHGYPEDLWFDIPGRKGDIGDPGYCVHGQKTFAPWHRPYLAMLEQALFIKMFDLANVYNEPLRTQYREAAYSFRLPYWDYYRPRGADRSFPGVLLNGQTTYKYDFSVPLIFTTPTVTVSVAPDNKSRPLSNPLNYYNFREKTGTLDEAKEWSKISTDTVEFPRQRTVRHPLSAAKPDNPTRMNSLVNELRMDSNRLAITLVTHPDYADWQVFSAEYAGHQAPGTDRGGRNAPAAEKRVFQFYGSLEAIHNMYHVYLGGFNATNMDLGGGHMSQVPCAAFDPLFWAHHGNIERMFTVWQAVHAGNAKSWFGTSESDQALAAEPLLPFLRQQKSNPLKKEDFWTAELAKSSKTFGYYFRDTGDSRNDLAGDQVAKKFQDQYTWSINQSSITPVSKDPPASMKPFPAADTSFFKDVPAVVAPSSQVPMSLMRLEPQIGISEELKTKAIEVSAVPDNLAPAEAKDTVVWDWYIDDLVERHAVNGSFTITYFIIEDPSVGLDTSRDLATAPDLVGLTHIFTSPIEACSNCASQAREGLVVRNTMFVTSQLIDYVKIGELANLEPDNVKPFLQKRLRWRVIKASGELIDPRRLAEAHQLEISISARKEVPGADSVPAEYFEYPEVVQNIIAAASPQAGHV